MLQFVQLHGFLQQTRQLFVRLSTNPYNARQIAKALLQQLTILLHLLVSTETLCPLSPDAAKYLVAAGATGLNDLIGYLEHFFSYGNTFEIGETL